MATTGDSASTASLRHTRGEGGTIRASLIFTVVAASSTRRRRLPRSNVAAPSSGALTKVPRPFSVNTTPSCARRVTARRTVMRLTPYSAQSSASEGRRSPARYSPFLMRSRMPRATCA